jgi:drug efflux transport system ATP-binding protein
VTVFVTTHYMDEAEHADRVSLMRAGRLIAIDSPSGLRERLPAGTLWEVEAADPLAALAALREASGVLEVTLHGALLHVRTDGGPDAAALTGRLATAGLSAERIEPIAPTLEDVFIALAGGRQP